MPCCWMPTARSSPTMTTTRSGRYVFRFWHRQSKATHGTDDHQFWRASQRLVDVVQPIHVNGRLIPVGRARWPVAEQDGCQTQCGNVTASSTPPPSSSGHFWRYGSGKQLTAAPGMQFRMLPMPFRGGSSGPARYRSVARMKWRDWPTTSIRCRIRQANAGARRISCAFGAGAEGTGR